MFELRTALSYLLPKKGQLSVSVVGILAVLVIQAITWLVLVFFSTTEGFQSRWTEKIVSILGPARIVPTAAYFDSPYYHLDSYSSKSGFISQRFSKKAKEKFLPYNPQEDTPLPPNLQLWYQKHAHDTPPLSLLLKRLDEKNIGWHFCESTVAHLSFPSLIAFPKKSITQYSALLGYDALQTENLSSRLDLTSDEFSFLLQKLHDHVDTLTPILRAFLQALGSFEVVVTENIDIPTIKISAGTRLNSSFSYDVDPVLHVTLPSNEIVSFSLKEAIPPITIPKPIPKKGLFLLRNPGGKAAYNPLSFIESEGYPILLPKVVRQQGVQLFDTGTFQVSGNDTKESLGIPFYVAGFFDPGVLPIGARIAITSLQAIMAIQPILLANSPYTSSSIVLDTDVKNLPETEKTVKKLLKGSLFSLFKFERYNELEFTKDLYQQLSSEKLLFRMLSLIIIAVACSNIFSMLFILAHDRRKEIAVMRALGASKVHITTIFLLTGLGVGLFGSVLGSLLGSLTLYYLPEILSLIAKIQGYELLNSAIYGDIAAQQISFSTLFFTLVSVSLASAFAGSIAAMRACHINISDSLKGGG